MAVETTCAWGTLIMQGSVFFWRKHHSHPPGWPACHWHRTSSTERDVPTAWAEPYRWVYFKPKPLQHWSQWEIFHTLVWESITSILLHLLLTVEGPLSPLISFEIFLWIIYLSIPAKPVRTSTPWQSHCLFLEILQKAFQGLHFPPGPSLGNQDIRFFLQETW